MKYEQKYTYDNFDFYNNMISTDSSLNHTFYQFVPPLKVKKLSPDAILPVTSVGNAGYDLYSIDDYTIDPGERKLIKTGICIEIPQGHYGHISDRSGMAYKFGAHCLGKIIDENYRGEIGIIILNTSKNTITIKKGERPAQIIFKKYERFGIQEVEELGESSRGDKGYGSSGK